MVQTIWWKQITKARTLYSSIIQSILESRNIVLRMPVTVPWRSQLIEVVDDELHSVSSLRTLKVIDSPVGSIGEYFLNTYCKKEKRLAYRRNISEAEYLAKSNDVVLNHYIFWVKNVSRGKLTEWVAFLNDYQKHLPEAHMPMLVVLEVPEDTTDLPKNTDMLNFSSEITEYDRYTFCALVSSEIEIAPKLRPYLVELVVAICENDIEFSAECIQYGQRFIENPLECINAIQTNCQRTDGSYYNYDFSQQDIDRLTWMTQTKMIFPLIENFRADFIHMHYNEVKSGMPKTNDYGERLDGPEDVEIGLLKRMIGEGIIHTKSTQEYQTLSNFHEARNKLAHIKPIDVEKVVYFLIGKF